jgi:pimeloyl-ACP methyl ester carboxylesterase
MGAHTALACALAVPERVAAVAVITPAFDPDPTLAVEHWHLLAAALRRGGVEGFLAVYGQVAVAAAWREPVIDELRRRMALHDNLAAVADALDGIGTSRPFECVDDLAKISVPALVLASRDEPDPLHPLELARRYAAAIPHSELLEDDEGQVPLAWQGGRLSRRLLEFARATVK